MKHFKHKINIKYHSYKREKALYNWAKYQRGVGRLIHLLLLIKNAISVYLKGVLNTGRAI